MPAGNGTYLEYRQGVLCLEGRPLAGLVEELGTPFFLISKPRLVDNYRALERGLVESGGPPVLRYCAKANHEAAVLEALAEAGSHLLASHAAEVELALRCGFPPERLAYARPVSTTEELRTVLDAGVGLLHAHRPADLAILEAAAARAGRRVRVSLRLRQQGFVLSPLDRLGRRLGFDPDEAVAACRQLARSAWLEPTAVNFYLGTQQSSIHGFAKMFRGVLALLRRLAAETGAEIREVNLGGGVPSPSLRRIGPARLLARWRDRQGASGAKGTDGVDRREEFARRLAQTYRDLVAAARLPTPPVLAAEPGRSIVGDAVVLVARVLGVEGRWAFLDASRSFLAESPLLFARRILPLVEPAAGGAESLYHLSGGSLNTLDVLDLRRRLPRLDPGAALAFCDAGAYSISRASAYAGMPPAVHMIEADGGVRLVRRAGTVEHLLHPMVPSTARAPRAEGRH